MAFSESWSVLEPDLETVFDHEADPLQALADARIPGIALRGAYNPDHCSGLMQRFIERGMTRDPEQPNPDGNLPSRIDIGSSLVNRARGGLRASDDETEIRMLSLNTQRARMNFSVTFLTGLPTQ